MKEEEALVAAKMAKDRGITFEVVQRSELRGDVIHWPPGLFSIWLQNPHTGLTHRMDELDQAEAVLKNGSGGQG